MKSFRKGIVSPEAGIVSVSCGYRAEWTLALALARAAQQTIVPWMMTTTLTRFLQRRYLKTDSCAPGTSLTVLVSHLRIHQLHRALPVLSAGSSSPSGSANPQNSYSRSTGSGLANTLKNTGLGSTASDRSNSPSGAGSAGGRNSPAGGSGSSQGASSSHVGYNQAGSTSTNGSGNAQPSASSRASGFLSSLTGSGRSNNSQSPQHSQQQTHGAVTTPPSNRIAQYDNPHSNVSSPPIVVVSPENVSDGDQFQTRFIPYARAPSAETILQLLTCILSFD